MMKKIDFNYLIVLFLGALLFSCTERDDTFTVSRGEADFTNYVAFGNSLTAGYADNALYDDGQLVSYANLLAEQMQLVGGGDFKIPMTHSDIGVGSSGNSRLVLGQVDGNLSPVPATENGAGDLSIFTESVAGDGPFNNMGIPGATALAAVFNGYGNPRNGEGNFNPFFTRMLTPDNFNASMLEIAVSQKPTFFTVFIGNNDVLGYATSGGAGSPISPEGQFSAAYEAIINAFMTNEDAKGAVANIPDVTSTPFFTTIPYNALVLNAEQAEQLNGGIDQMLSSLGLDRETAAGLVDLPDFQEGPNALFVKDDHPANVMGIRQMEKEELVVLTAQADLQALQSNLANAGAIFAEIGAALAAQDFEGIKTAARQLALPDKDFLSKEQVDEIVKATEAFNAKIKSTAEAHDLAFVDVNRFFKEVAENGIILNGRTITTEFVTGGAFSLDGIHLTPIGNVLLANEFIKAINKTYDARIPRVDPSSFGGVQFP